MTIHWGLKTRNDRSVQETEQYLYCFLPLIHRTVQLSWALHTTAGAWRVFFFFLLYGGSQTYKCITATYLSNEPLTFYLQSQLVVSMVDLRDSWYSTILLLLILFSAIIESTTTHMRAAAHVEHAYAVPCLRAEAEDGHLEVKNCWIKWFFFSLCTKLFS